MRPEERRRDLPPETDVVRDAALWALVPRPPVSLRPPGRSQQPCCKQCSGGAGSDRWPGSEPSRPQGPASCSPHWQGLAVPTDVRIRSGPLLAAASGDREPDHRPHRSLAPRNSRVTPVCPYVFLHGNRSLTKSMSEISFNRNFLLFVLFFKSSWWGRGT